MCPGIHMYIMCAQEKDRSSHSLPNTTLFPKSLFEYIRAVGVGILDRETDTSTKAGHERTESSQLFPNISQSQQRLLRVSKATQNPL